ncbi:hypothetical protein KIH23_02540 [Flavobacterium sp. CYK-55]|uniref:hypothetical protein n=1 Tax=Flavobacterium sp. CYK-55 TaxID=2835529 RepID=UPI001BD05DE2|nr:hypothetical protein [Flavobacterium sp. CYK-55]MBS7786162.1 hypothetical protein [Flavobacterium sp. CYK-55]
MRFYYSLILVLSFVITSCSERDAVNNHDTTTDVYVGGQKDNRAVYWKNNQIINLDDTGFNQSIVDSLVVKSQKVYVLGSGEYTDGANIYTHKLLWVNGVLTDLHQAYATNTSDVISIGGMAIIDSDLYISGIIHDLSVTPNVYRLVYWKNGERTQVAELSDADYIITGMGWQEGVGHFSVTHPTLESGMYVDGTFTAYTNTEDFGFFLGINGLYVFGNKDGHPYYQKIGSDAVINPDTSGSFTKLSEFGSGIFALNGSKIYRNGTEDYYTADQNLEDFQWANNNLYTLEYSVSGGTNSYTVKQNGSQISQSDFSNICTCLFVNIF